MKFIKTTTLIFLVFALFQSCKKESGDLTIRFAAKVNGETFELDKKFKSVQNKWFKAERLKFYVSDLSILVGGKTILLKDILLTDFSKPEMLTYTFSDFEEVTIDAVQFGLGVKPALNNPSKTAAYDLGVFADNHPLSAAQNMYWGMTNDYRFFVYEGRSDTSLTQDVQDALYKNFLYHTGLDKMYRSVVVNNTSFTISENNRTLTLVLDLNKVFSSGSDSIDIGVESYTEAMGEEQELLAAKLSDNIQKAFQIGSH